MRRSGPLSAGLVFTLLGLAACAGHEAPPATSGDTSGPDRSAAWESAHPYDEFVAGDTANQAIWLEQAAQGAPADLVARAQAAGGEWKLLVVAESWCSDAAFSVPALAALADSVTGLELRLLRTEGNDALFAGHERNGRAAHPLILVLDGNGRERAGWVERPAQLAAWIDARRGTIPDDDIRLYRRGWYEGNSGRAALAEVLDLVEDVRNGRVSGPAAFAGSREDRPITPCPAPD
jgi:hypothetical protein